MMKRVAANVFSRSAGARMKSTAASPQIFQEIPEMPPCDFQPQPYKGPSYPKTLSIRGSKINPALWTYYSDPMIVNQGHMQWLFDHEGRRYLDLFAGIVTVSVGHCHPKVNQALKDQTDLLWHTTNVYLHPKIHEYAEKLTSKLPDHLSVVYFTNSGSEANDLAILMSRMYTGRYDILSHRSCYHGGSPYLMGLTSMSTWRYQTPVGFGYHQTMNPDIYRGVWGGKNCRDSPIQTKRGCSCGMNECQANDMYVEQLRDVIRHSTPKSGLAGFIAETIQGGGGTIQYPKNYLKDAFDVIKGQGGVCISDEVQTGFGRTGTHYWGFEGAGISPDIVTMAKGIGNGFPLAAVVTTPEIASVMSGALHFNTFGGNPLACAVGSAVLDAIDEDNCQELSHDIGTYFLEQLGELRDEFEIVGDVRGKGLMTGVEMVQNKETKEPLEKERFVSIWDACKEMGVLLGKGGLYGHVFRIKPPMCITKEDVDFAVAVMRKALSDHTGK